MSAAGSGRPAGVRSSLLSLGTIALTLALTYGIWYSYSVIMVALLKEFGWSRSILAGAFSVFTLTHGIANPLVGWLCERFQPPRIVAVGGILLGLALSLNSLIATPWHLYLSFGVLTALAVAASGWVPALMQAQRRFPQRLGLALGIVSAGVGVGMMAIVPICQALIDAFGWRVAFRVLGLACVLWIVPAAIYLLRTTPSPAPSPVVLAPKTAPSASSRHSGPARAPRLAEAARTAPFWLIMAAFFFGNICSQTLHVHQVAFLVDHGVAAIVAASVVSAVGASSIVAKIAGGWLSDSVGRELVYVTCIGILLASILALASVGAFPSRWGAYGYAVLLGVGYSVTASITPALAADRFSGPHFGAIVGMGLFASAIGSALGPWLAGFLFDLTQSYVLPLAIAAGGGVISGAAVWKLWQLRLRERPQS